MFQNDFMAINPGVSSKAVSGYDGVYVFTPVARTISYAAPKDSDAVQIAKEIKDEKDSAIESSVFKTFYEKSKIIRNLKNEPVENN